MKKICTAIILAVLTAMLLCTVVYAAEAITITRQPEDIEAPIGSTGSAKVEAEGEITYRWYFKKANGTQWQASGMKGYNTDTIYVPVTEARLGQQYKCVLTDSEGNTAETEVVVVKNASPATVTIDEQPTDIKAAIGVTGSATVVASSDNGAALSYRWYFKNASVKTWTASGMKGYNTDTIYVPVTAARLGQQYKCVVTTADGGVAETDTVEVRKPDPSVITIVTEPSDIRAKLGSTGTAAVEAETNTGAAMTYQWYFMPKNGAEWKASGFAGNKTAEITVPVAATRIGQQYKCVITTSDGGVAETVPVKVAEPLPTEITIVSQPMDLYGAIGENASATVEASGDSASALAYCWYFKAKNSSEWKASGFAGCKTATITVPVATTRLGQQYKCVITTADGGRVESDVITVCEKPALDFAVTGNPDNYRMNTGDPVDLHISVNVDTGKYPVRYQWYKDGEKIPGACGRRYYIASFTAEDAGEYYCVAYCCGYTATSATATVRTLG